MARSARSASASCRKATPRGCCPSAATASISSASTCGSDPTPPVRSAAARWIPRLLIAALNWFPATLAHWNHRRILRRMCCFVPQTIRLMA
ncbi:RING-H2 finger protein [Musa troglodytarum]|uniref:RING-H2 finger protein n=1 Tax=Musa troglodytarum TaxID=320322 RepID=A0A9E7HBX7_9LILI|nr:RING-H2 finger protein [Musa troglodytarum]